MTTSTDLVTTDGNAPAIVSQLETVAPLLTDLGIDRRTFVATLVTQLNANPQLRECTPESFVAAAFKSARLGLHPGDELGWCWLIPRRLGGRNKPLQVTWMLGYQGMVELARRAGVTITVGSVYEGDTYEERGGTDPDIVHVHGPRHGVGQPVRWYAVAHLPSGTKITRSLSREQVEQRRLRGEGQTTSETKHAWAVSYDAMARKSAIRALWAQVPAGISDQMVDAVQADGHVAQLPAPDRPDDNAAASPDVEHLGTERDQPDLADVVPDQLDEALVLNLEEWRHAAGLDGDATWHAWIARHCDGAASLGDVTEAQARALLTATRARAENGDA